MRPDEPRLPAFHGSGEGCYNAGSTRAGEKPDRQAAEEEDSMEFDAHAQAIEMQGFTIVENAIEPGLIDALIDMLEGLELALGTEPARNDFEGRATTRVYNLLARDRLFEKVPIHPQILPIVERVLDPGCLVSSLSSIRILPGELPQPLHADDQLIPIARPHPPLICNTMWALTDFTAENGATRFVPGSHKSATAGDLSRSTAGTRCAEMRRGSVLVWDGSLWHGGGANSTDKPRIGLAMNYCAGFMRQQENQQLGIPPERLRAFAPRLQQLVGLDIYNGLIGHIDKKRPLDVLNGTKSRGVIWDVR